MYTGALKKIDEVWKTIDRTLESTRCEQDDSCHDCTDMPSVHLPLHLTPAERRDIALGMIRDHQPQWSDDQCCVLEQVINIMYKMKCNGEDNLFHGECPPLMLITGGPGTGKTTVIHEITDKLGEKEVMAIHNIITTCFMGVAAVAIHGSTISTLFNLGHQLPKDTATTVVPLGPQQVQELQARLGLDKHHSLFLIIDEISMVTATMLAIIDLRLRQATNINQPFGGVPLALFGDFSQIAPVGGVLLTDAIMKATEVDITLRRCQLNSQNPPDSQLPLIQNYRGDSSRITANLLQQTTLFRKGIELFARAKWFPLRKQNRSKDPEHTTIIEHIASGKSMTKKQLQHYKHLQPEDLCNPRWRFAPILVSTNRERFDITEVQAKSFAKVNGTVVLRWKKRIEKWTGQPRNHQKALCMKIRCFGSISLLGLHV
jgi:PIF1-like helicase